MYKMARRIRVNWTIDVRAYNLLKKVDAHSMSAVVSKLILDKFQDPVKKLVEENKELAKKINENQEKIKRMLEDKEDAND
jgi:hypothetical protein